MKVLKPTAVGILRNGSSWVAGPNTLLAVPLNFVEEDSGYFSQTYNRPENNCVHAKVVAPGRIKTTVVPIKFTVNNVNYGTNGVTLRKTSAYQPQSVTVTIDGVSFMAHYSMQRRRKLDGWYFLFKGIANLPIFQHVKRRVGVRDCVPYVELMTTPNNEFAEARRKVQLLSDSYLGSEVSEDNLSSFIEGITATLLHVVVEVVSSDYWPSASSNWALSQIYDLTTLDVLYSIPSKDRFLFYEPYWIADGVDPLLFGRSTNNYWLGVMYQEVTQSALTNLPVANDNNIQNVSSIIAMIRAIVLEHSVPLPKSWQDAWLQYRYVYKTTKSDIEENISFLRRNLSVLDTGLSTYGITHRTVNGIDVTMRCDIKMKRRELSTLKKLGEALYMYGLSPDLYIIWDSIPFSFIVDWFLPVGDLASAVDRRNAFSRGNYEFESIIYSLSYEIDGCRYYSRWVEKDLKPLQALYWFEPNAGTKTVLARIIDTAALIIK
jgi:hypothetical protein